MSLAACAVALMLLIDVSGSVTDERYNLQKVGIIEAFQSPEIQQIIDRSEGVAVSIVEWGGTQKITIDWRILNNRESINKFSLDYKNSSRDTSFLFRIDTDITSALEYGVKQFNNIPCEPMYKIIDVSGDGANSNPNTTKNIIELAETLYITINGLPIVTSIFPKLDEHYRENVITKDGFVAVAEGFEDFNRAIRRKLLKEIAEGIKINGKI